MSTTRIPPLPSFVTVGKGKVLHLVTHVADSGKRAHLRSVYAERNTERGVSDLTIVPVDDVTMGGMVLLQKLLDAGWYSWLAKPIRAEVALIEACGRASND